MPQYGCQKCGSTGSVMEMRRVVINAGPSKELQVAGVIPVQRCLNEKCNAMSTACNLEIGELAGLEPSPVALEPTPPADAEAQEAAKMTELIEMKQKMAELESELVEDPKTQTDPSADKGTHPLEGTAILRDDAYAAMGRDPGFERVSEGAAEVDQKS